MMLRLHFLHSTAGCLNLAIGIASTLTATPVLFPHQGDTDNG